MHNFDGSYKRRPLQNLGGTSQTYDRDATIRKAQLERQKRNLLRQQNNAATVIQSYARSFIWRQRIKQKEREAFDEFLRANNDSSLEAEKLSFLLQRFNFYYYFKNATDRQRLIELCQQILRTPKQIILRHFNHDIRWQIRLYKLLDACLTQLVQQTTLQAIPLRMLETFLTGQEGGDLNYLKYIFAHFNKSDYFGRLCHLLEDKCPPIDGETLLPPNALMGVIAQLFKSPLALAKRLYSDSVEETLATELCNSFVSQILTRTHSDALRYYLLPHLANEFIEFPFDCMIHHLSKTLTDMEATTEVQETHQNDLLFTNKPITFFCTDNTNEQAQEEIRRPAKVATNPKKHINFNAFLLHSLLTLDRNQYSLLQSESLITQYMRVIASMSGHILFLPKSNNRLMSDHGIHEECGGNSSDEDVEMTDDDDTEVPLLSTIEKDLLVEAVIKLSDAARIDLLVAQLSKHSDNYELLSAVCEICHNLSIYDRYAIFDHKLLYTLAFLPSFVRGLWLKTEASLDTFSAPLRLISKGIAPRQDGLGHVIPVLATFCTLFGRLLPTLHDVEFLDDYSAFGNSKRLMPFSINETVRIIKFLKETSVGLVELAFPDTRYANSHYRDAFGIDSKDENKSRQMKQTWSNLLKVVILVLNQLHTRDLRLSFCPKDHWCVDHYLNLPLDRPSDLQLTRASRLRARPFYPVRDFTRQDFENGPPMSTRQIRSITILREIPFVVQFNKRVKILLGLIEADKLREQGITRDFLQGPTVTITVRRTHLYEDAYDKLHPDNAPNLRISVRVQFISKLGLDEAGIDGGGVFREFLSEFIKSAFDPNRGFFMLTTDNKLYPNPNIADICTNFEDHYYFIGRIVGKAIYENSLVELPLAEFFLTKLAGKYADVDIHQLASLDPELYKNLLYLKDHEEDIGMLNLDFTIACSSLGQTQIVELVPQGQNIPVTASNRIKYLQLVADYKLNVQIRRQCLAFRRGLSNVLPIEWLYMFSNNELQILLSGAEIPIDLEDLKKHCNYGGDYSPEHPSIIAFWAALESFSDAQRRQLLKFVTSCSRPPLLGFKNLSPPFYIQNASDTDRLPTASTCVNMLKLPPLKTVEQMREKLLYAIQAGQGFELS